MHVHARCTDFAPCVAASGVANRRWTEFWPEAARWRSGTCSIHRGSWADGPRRLYLPTLRSDGRPGPPSVRPPRSVFLRGRSHGGHVRHGASRRQTRPAVSPPASISVSARTFPGWACPSRCEPIRRGRWTA